MDFIERIFHLAPDGGNGLLELSLVLAVLGAPILFVVLRSFRRRRPDSLGSRVT